VSGAGKGCLGLSILMAGVFAVLFGLIFFLWPSTRTEPAKQLEAERGPVQKMVTDKVPADGTGTTTKQATQKRMSTFVMIAAGSSVVGCVASNNPDLACFNDEPVASPRNFAALEVMRTEVTVAEYGTCVASGHCAKPEPGAGCNYEVKGKEQHPMNCVSWTEAVTWCGFANARLPTPDEWERVARGSTTGVFPWGDAEPNGSRANLCDRNCPNLPSVDEKILPRSKRIQLDVDDGYAGTAPVGSYPEGANSEGVLDLVGNVWEWTDGDWRVGKKERRGGSFIDRPRGLRISNRFGSEPETRSVHTGFRCVR
jgi:formylglycine-generating enzyme required for sulfatase activity